MALMIEHPTTASNDPRQTEFDRLCRDMDTVDAALPDGYRVEVIGGRIVMSPWSQGCYHRLLDSLLDQLAPHVPAGHRARTTPSLYVFPQQVGACGPDLHVADNAAIDIRTHRLPGSALSLVAEQTSQSTRETDWTHKVGIYGKAEVPVYILLDMQEATVTVFHDPTPDLGYRQRAQIKFGDRVHIPEPFDFWLDTADWDDWKN